LQHIGRNSYFGTAQDLNAYGASDDITAVVGGQYRYHMFNCLFMPADLSAGVEYQYNRLRDQIMGYGRDIRQNVHLYGGYVQNEWKNKDVSFLIGLRGEKHSMLKRPIFSPRANVRYTPIKEVVLRASYASGYRAPQTYDEDLHVGAVGGEVSLIQLSDSLRPEMSHSVSASVDWAKKIGAWETNVTLEGFFTQLNDVFSLVENGHDDLGNLLLLRTNEKGARVYGMNIEGKVAYKTKFVFQLGYTYQRSRYIEAVTWSEDESILPQTRMFRTPDHYGYFMATYEPIRKFTINLNGKLTGPMLIQHYAGYVDRDEEVISPTFFDMGIKLAYEIPLYRLYSLEINAGVKNIFDSFQRDIDQGIDRDAGYIYGPSLPRTYFFGLNFKL
jgi:outer membrane receptor for ferrienterochelin and colicins